MYAWIECISHNMSSPLRVSSIYDVASVYSEDAFASCCTNSFKGQYIMLYYSTTETSTISTSAAAGPAHATAIRLLVHQHRKILTYIISVSFSSILFIFLFPFKLSKVFGWHRSSTQSRIKNCQGSPPAKCEAHPVRCEAPPPCQM